jgi:DNA polymerase/3'-5' exonuclease PolX
MSYPLHNAILTAARFRQILAPHCDRIHLAGSIRRERPEVKDIEIVCSPKKELKVDTAVLFDEGTLRVSVDFLHALSTITREVIKGNPEGRYMQIKTKSQICPGIQLDLFIPASQDYYRQLVIRTGSAEYVANEIASAWVRNGWVGAGEHGLRRKEDCERVISGDSKKWKLINPDGERPPAWTSEQDFYQWLGLKWISPVYREYKPTLNAAQ